MANGCVPYRTGFAFEYPPGAIPPLALPALVHRSYVPLFHAFEFLCLLGAVAAVALTTRRVVPTVVVAVTPALVGQISLNSFDL